MSLFNNSLTVTEYTIYSNKIVNSVKIVLLTDLHSCEHGKSQQILIEKIKEQNPDIILMSGDIMDDIFPDSNTVELLKGIAYQYPCYYVTGNHECRSGRVDKQKNLFRTYDVVVLEGECKEVCVNKQNLFICGVDDPKGGKAAFDRQLSNASGLINAKQYSVLLSHRPELFELYVVLYP